VIYAGITRAEHLQWCKDRALLYVYAGDLQGALVAFAEDVVRHPLTRDLREPIDELGIVMIDDPRQMRRFIEGFQ
jgi:hypothetical protein